MTARVAILGAGGHGRVVADILRAMASAGTAVSFAGFLDAALDISDKAAVFGPRLGEDADLAHLVQGGQVTHFLVGLGAVRGGRGPRARLFEAAAATGALPFRAVHPGATIAPDVEISPGVVVMAGAVLNTGGVIGDNAIINTGGILDHDVRIGPHAHVAPRSVCSGDVTIGAHALFGVGAVARQGIQIGDEATVAAGAVVINDVAAGATVAGCPAVPLPN